jgi:hypothetical protein
VTDVTRPHDERSLNGLAITPFRFEGASSPQHSNIRVEERNSPMTTSHDFLNTAALTALVILIAFLPRMF